MLNPKRFHSVLVLAFALISGISNAEHGKVSSINSSHPVAQNKGASGSSRHSNYLNAFPVAGSSQSSMYGYGGSQYPYYGSAMGGYGGMGLGMGMGGMQSMCGLGQNGLMSSPYGQQISPYSQGMTNPYQYSGYGSSQGGYPPPPPPWMLAMMCGGGSGYGGYGGGGMMY